MPDLRQSQQRLLLIVFVLSGFAGLIYQSIWSHYLGLFLGHAAYAQALVLAIFMGGMALGAAWVARAGERWRNLILGYAIIEAVIGVLGLAFHSGFVGLLGLSYDSIIPAMGAPWAVNAYKWALAAALILPQTILLGMTFPLMSGGLIRRFPGQDGSLLGGLYFTNSIGAAVGALAAGFLLMPRLGLPGAMAVAGVLNLVVAVLAAWVARHPEPAPRAVRADVASDGGRGRRLLFLVLCGTALSGAASFVYEIVWIRMLSLAVGSTLHAFELMLASFIAGIAFGGLWIRKRADSTTEPLRLLGWLQVWMGVTALLSLVFYANAFEWVGWLMQALGKTDQGYVLFNFGTAAIAMLIMLPSAFFAGTTLPLFTVVLLRDGQGERSIGRVYAWNTLGAIVGVFAAIHLLIPVLGLKLALCAAAAVDMLIGLALLRWRVDSAPSMRRFAFAGGIAAVALALSISQVHFDPLRLASGVFRTGQTMLSDSVKVRYYRDGKTASISAYAFPGGTVSIVTNGKPDASIQMNDELPATLDEPTMILAAAYPLAMHPNPRTVGVIGFGSGLTTHALLGDDRVERVDTIEIETAMVEGARVFGHRVARAYDDPRSNIIIDDAKSYFSGQQTRYDIIVSEPSNPWVSGVGALFSKEFYEFVPRHLADDGLMVQWLQLYEIDDTLVTSILNALTPAFEDYVAYLSNTADLLIIASPKGKVPAAAFERVFEGALGEDLRRIGLDRPEQLAFRKVADARLLRALGRAFGGEPNSDYHPILSLRAPRTRFRQLSAQTMAGLPNLDLPLLDLLGVRQPLPLSIEPPTVFHFPADHHTREARVLLDLLRGESVKPNRDVVNAFAMVRSLRQMGAACDATDGLSSGDEVVEHLMALARATLAVVPAEGMRGALIDPVWMTCDEYPVAFLEAMALVEALAARDHAAMEARGLSWLDGREQRAEGWKPLDPLAYASIQLALLAGDRLDEIPALEESLGSTVSATGEYAKLRTLLLAMSDD